MHIGHKALLVFFCHVCYLFAFHMSRGIECTCAVCETLTKENWQTSATIANGIHFDEHNIKCDSHARVATHFNGKKCHQRMLRMLFCAIQLHGCCCRITYATRWRSKTHSIEKRISWSRWKKTASVLHGEGAIFRCTQFYMLQNGEWREQNSQVTVFFGSQWRLPIRIEGNVCWCGMVEKIAFSSREKSRFKMCAGRFRVCKSRFGVCDTVSTTRCGRSKIWSSRMLLPSNLAFRNVCCSMSCGVGRFGSHSIARSNEKSFMGEFQCWPVSATEFQHNKVSLWMKCEPLVTNEKNAKQFSTLPKCRGKSRETWSWRANVCHQKKCTRNMFPFQWHYFVSPFGESVKKT